MMWHDWDDDFRLSQNAEEHGHGTRRRRRRDEEEDAESSNINFDLLSLISKPKDYYRILEVDYDATEEAIRSNYIRLALKWHPDKQKDQDSATSKFQEINEAYQVLIDPEKRQEYDKKGMLRAYDYNIVVSFTTPSSSHLPSLGSSIYVTTLIDAIFIATIEGLSKPI